MSRLFTVLATTDPGALSLGSLLLPIGFLIFTYFILIRPQRKQQKEIANMQKTLKIGDSVLTVGGLYGQVVDIVNDVIIIEFGTNKSVRVPIERPAIKSIAEPDLSVAKVEDEA